jgi:hypothetical protein
MTLGYFAGTQIDLAVGAAMWAVAVVMFVSGHRIEGNIRYMTPVLLFRLLSKVVHDFVAHQVHLLRA